VIGLAGLLLAAGSAAGCDAAWLDAWAREQSAAPGLMKTLHDAYSLTSPHAADSVNYEALVRTRTCVDGGGPALEAVRVKLERVLVDASAPPSAAERAARALGWLQQPASIAALRTSAQAGNVSAVMALRFFGAHEVLDGFVVYGGMPAYQRFKPVPAPDATQALLALSEHTNKDIRAQALRALLEHEGGAVAERFAAAAAGCDDVTPLNWLETNAVPQRTPLLTKCLSAATPDVRAAAAHALGVAGERAAIPQLLALLDDPSAQVFVAAHRALSRLEGFVGEPPNSSVEDRKLLTPMWRARLGPRP
jgi:HEAT repeat protein